MKVILMMDIFVCKTIEVAGGISCRSQYQAASFSHLIDTNDAHKSFKKVNMGEPPFT